MSNVNKKIKGTKVGEYNGIKFRSQLEIKVAKYLIASNIPFEYESLKLLLLPSFKYHNQTFRSVHYTPDFKCGDYLIEVKGYPNDVWKLKRKLVANYILTNNLPYKFREVHSVQELKKVIDEINNSKK